VHNFDKRNEAGARPIVREIRRIRSLMALF
jgi:hypothetical protein